MILYWTGQISLGEEENLLDLFFENAQDKLAAYAIEFIGISLSNIQETISLSVLQRITHFWEWRSLQIIKKGVTKHNHELAAFGWWFISKKFDDLWSIDHLKKVLVINAGKIDFEHEVVKQLAKLMPKMPREVLECLSIIVKCNKTAWQIYHWKDDAIFILNSALKIEDLNEEARAIIDHLCASGYFEFNKLLKE
jgi:hypothetical protein